jgi:hypothetical protein
MSFTCKFCDKKLQYDQVGYMCLDYMCPDCNVKFLVNSGRCYYITYYFKDEVYHAMSMNLNENTTSIFIFINNALVLEFNMIFPDTKPEDAMKLAKRLHNISAFA